MTLLNQDEFCAAVERALVKAEHDPLRPTYHFRAPAQWMNDPNGTVFRNGIVELFYQFNPFADTFGKMHWGHARTKDFLTWEHHPVALAPQHAWREDECWSGCCTTTSSEGPLAIYTSIEGVSGGPMPNTIRLARGSEDFVEWVQEEEPVLRISDVPESVRNDWRDPYLFTANGTHFMVVGAVLRGEKEQPTVLLFKALDSSLRRWEYAGRLFDADEECTFPECPNFFELDGKWILIVSGKRPVEYHGGSFSFVALHFDVERSGVIDYSSEFYATNTIVDDSGRTVLFGWIRGFPKGRGWNGCLALPRAVRLAQDGSMLQAPVRETEKLRQHRFEIPSERLCDREIILNDASVLNLELQLSFCLGENASIDLEFGNEADVVFRVTFDCRVLRVGGINVALREDLGSTHSIRLFTDRSVLELFADDGRYCATRVVESLVSCSRLRIRTSGSVEVTELVYWSMGRLEFVRKW